MTNRREFLELSAGIAFVGCSLLAARSACAQPRKQTVIAGKRIRVIDMHAHCAVPEALSLMGLKIGGPQLRPDLVVATTAAERIATMDAQGIDMQALSINPNWYKTD